MAPSKLRQAIGAMKDQTSISLAKVGNSTCLSDLEVAIVKATRHEEHPPEERHIREILSLTIYSRNFISVCVDTIARRLNKTKNWVVALKSVMLIHRLLLEGDPAYEQEIFFSTRRGTRLLNLMDFRDTAMSDSWDHSAFVRMYALYLDQQLEFKMQGRRGKRSTFAYEEEEGQRDEEEDGEEEEVVRRSRSNKSRKVTPVREMKNEQVFSRIQRLLQLLERFLACRPTGTAKHNRIVNVALYLTVKESFQIYYDIAEVMSVLIDRFMELDIPDSVKVYELFCRISKQFDELDSFYGWCKAVGIARSSEYPEVEKVTPKKLDVMEDFMREKSNLAQKRKSFKDHEHMNEYVEEVKEPEPEQELEPELEPEPDMNAIKALPAPEEVQEEIKEDTKKESDNKAHEVGDLLNLGEDALTKEEQANRFALALFEADLTTSAPSSGTSAWQAFSDTNDWETALVQSASQLSNQKATLPGGFDTLLLDGMYQQGALKAATTSSGLIATGSDSSVAFGSAGRPAMLALPAPESGATMTTTSGGDPFAASLAVAPPSYVQMAEMEKKQKLLLQEQMMWQQYGKDGMQGHVGLTKLQQNQYPYPYNMQGYTQSY